MRPINMQTFCKDNCIVLRYSTMRCSVMRLPIVPVSNAQLLPCIYMEEWCLTKKIRYMQEQRVARHQSTVQVCCVVHEYCVYRIPYMYHIPYTGKILNPRVKIPRDDDPRSRNSLLTSTQLNSTQLNSTQLNSTQLNSTQAKWNQHNPEMVQWVGQG